MPAPFAASTICLASAAFVLSGFSDEDREAERNCRQHVLCMQVLRRDDEERIKIRSVDQFVECRDRDRDAEGFHGPGTSLRVRVADGREFD